MAVGSAIQVHHCIDGRDDEAVQRLASQTSQGSQRLKARHDVCGGVRVHRSATTLMAGVERSEQVDDFGAPNLADDEAVRAHPQGLPNEVSHRHRTCSLDVRWTRLEEDDVGMQWRQLTGVFNNDEPLLAC